jgi:hypothetical protein
MEIPDSEENHPREDFIPHLDVGNPNSGLGGMLAHVFIDFFKGHLPGANLNPNCK